MMHNHISDGKSKNRGRAKRIFLMVIAAMVIAVLLELGTIFGSIEPEGYSPAHWSKKRLVVFFFIGLLIAWVFQRISWNDFFNQIKNWLTNNNNQNGHRAIAAVFGIIIISIFGYIMYGLLRSSLIDQRFSLLISILLIVLLIFFLFRQSLLHCIEAVFVLLALSFGLLMCLLIVPLPAIIQDGQIHYDSALKLSYITNVQYSYGDYIAVDGHSYKSFDLPENENKHEGWYAIRTVEQMEAVEKGLLDAEAQGLFLKIVGSKSIYEEYPFRPYNIGNIPNAIGLWIARLLHLNILGQLFLGRLANLLVYILAFFLGIRYLKRGKIIMTVVGLLPSALFTATNFTYDAVSISFIALSFARFVGDIQRTNERVDLSKSLWIFIPFVLGSCVRAVYFPLALIFLFMPRSRFVERSNHVKFIIGVFVCIVILLASFAAPFIFALLTHTDQGDTRVFSDVSPSRQVNFILTNPLAYAQIFFRHFAVFAGPRNLFFHLSLGGGYTFESANLGGNIISTCIGCFVLFVAIKSAFANRFNKHIVIMCIAVLLIVFCTILLIDTALYISFNPVGATTISGVQTRYLLPFVIPVLLTCLETGEARRPQDTQKGTAILVCIELIILLVVSFYFYIY